MTRKTIVVAAVAVAVVEVVGVTRWKRNSYGWLNWL